MVHSETEPSDSSVRKSEHRERFNALLHMAATPGGFAGTTGRCVTMTTSGKYIMYCDILSQSYYDPITDEITRWPSMLPRRDKWSSRKLKLRWAVLMRKIRANVGEVSTAEAKSE